MPGTRQKLCLVIWSFRFRSKQCVTAQIKADCFSILAWGYLVPFSKLELLLLQIRYKGDLFKIWISPLAFFNFDIMFKALKKSSCYMLNNKITVNTAFNIFYLFEMELFVQWDVLHFFAIISVHFVYGFLTIYDYQDSGTSACTCFVKVLRDHTQSCCYSDTYTWGFYMFFS
jgi:hypothetical protein